MDTRGLPQCPTSALQATSSDLALSRCRPALVGKGSFVAQLPVEQELLVGGRALVFNGTVDGRPGMLIHIYVSDPVRLTLVIPIKISRQDGRFGTVLTTTVPKLAGGSASIVAAEAEDRPPVPRRRRTAQLPERRLRRPRRLPRRRLPLRPRQLQLLRRAHHAHRPQPQLPSSKVSSDGDAIPRNATTKGRNT